MNSPYFTLTFEIVSMAFFVLYFVFSYLNYDRRFNVKYNIRNTFPYEFNYHGTFKDNFLGNVMLVVSLLFGLVGSLLFDNTHTGFMIFVMVSSCLGFASIGALNIVSLKEIKLHLIAAILNLAFTFMLSTAILISSMQLIQIQGEVQVASIFSLAIAIICLLASFIMIMNPKLISFPNMIKVVDEKGKESYQRPKYYVLAFSEWLSTFLIFVLQIGVIILSFVSK